MKRIVLISISFLFVLGTAWAQRTVSGIVTSDDGSGGIPGVNVILKGTTSGTTTDLDGNYRLSVPEEGGTLEFSFIGLSPQEIMIGSRSVIDITMSEDVETLGEVVVTALGVEREKKALGYAVSNLNSSEITKRSEPDAIRSLTGKIAGVNIQGGGGAPGQSTKINIRGYSSMTGNTQPLFVVDGVPFDNSVQSSDDFSQNTVFSNRAFDIDPNNIESVTVLKGASAAALYGSRASNGVILITTKANNRSTSKGLEVRYNLSYAQEKISSVPDYQNTYMQGSNQVYNGGYVGNWGQPFPDQVDAINAQYGTNYTKSVVPSSLSAFYPDGTAPHPLVGISRNYSQQQYWPDLLIRDGYSFGADGAFINGSGDHIPDPTNPTVFLGVPINLTSHDNVGGFFQTGSLMENSLNVSSSSEKASVNFTMSNSSNDGIIPNQSIDRTALGLGINSTLDNGLYIQGSVNYVNTVQKSPPSGASYNNDYGNGSGGSVYARLFYLPRNFDLNGYPYQNPVTGGNTFYRALDNPRWLVENNQFTSNVNRVFGNLTLSYDLTDWLTLMARGGFNQYTDQQSDFREKGGNSFNTGSYGEWTVGNREIDMNFLLQIDKKLSPDLRLTGTIGHNVNERSKNYNFGYGQTLIVMGQKTTNNSMTQSIGSGKELQRFYAFYADFTLGYKDYLFLNLLGRNDISSTLPKESRSYSYPSVSTSFIFTEALGIQSDLLNFGKLRVGYAQVGNQASPYSLYTTFGTALAYNGANRVSLSNSLNNLNLKPERTKELEIGTELRLFKNRLNADITWFKKNSFDQIVSANVATSSGFSRQVINSGEIQNDGWEIGLNGNPVSSPDGINWNVGVNFTKINSMIIDAGEGGDIIIGATGSNSSNPTNNIHRTGEPYGQIYGSRFARSDEGTLLIDRALGTPIQDNGSHVVGNPLPDWILGINNTVSFKGFSLTALFDYKKGGDILSYTAASLKLRGQLAYSTDREAVRVVPGVYGDRSTFEPILNDAGEQIQNTTGISSFDWYFSNGFAAYGPAEANVYDASVIRLRELQLGYSFDKSMLEKTPFGSASLGISMRNVWFNAPNMPEDMNFDPEVLGGLSSNNINGFDLGATPTTRRIGVNLSVTF